MLTDNPNAPDKYHGWTPIFLAAREGNTKIVETFVTLTDDPNAPDNGLLLHLDDSTVSFPHLL